VLSAFRKNVSFEWNFFLMQCFVRAKQALRSVSLGEHFDWEY